MGKSKYTKEMLQEAVDNCNSISCVCRYFGLKTQSGNNQHLKRRILDFGIDISHFNRGLGWAKGKKFGFKRPIEDYLTNKQSINTHDLKLRLFREEIKEPKCECCGIVDWRGEELPFHLDHIDSDNRNNNLSNLQILCPNCHNQKTRKDRKERAKVKKIISGFDSL